jgi:hypothetical protein
MGKGIKMSSARLISDNSIINISEISNYHRKNLKCRFCEEPLSFTKKHIRNETVVERFFRLYPKGNHFEDCKYQIKNLIDIIVKTSKDIENEKNIFDKDGDKHIFRLNVITETINHLEGGEAEKKEIKGKLNYETKNYIKSKQTLASYLKSAMGVAKLYALINDSETKKELKESIFIFNNAKKIKWSDFFFEPKRHSFLVSKKRFYPIALIVQFKPIEKGNNFLRCYKTSDILINNEVKIIIPNVWFNDEELKENIKFNRDYVIISKVNITTSGKFINLNMNVNHKGQISKMLKD